MAGSERRSQAVLIPTRGRIKKYEFTPGRLEPLHLDVWRVPSAEGLLRAKLTGQAYVVCGKGKEHYPEVAIEVAGHPANADSADLAAAYNRDAEAALRVAEELESVALRDWFDPCEAEGLDEEIDEKYDVYGEELDDLDE